MPETQRPSGEFILYTTEDGQTRIECRFENETIWLSQALMAELFDRNVRTINEHLTNIYEEHELDPESTIRKFRIVRQEGSRSVTRTIDHYNLEAILAVGFRIKSPRGTQFRRWANSIHNYPLSLRERVRVRENQTPPPHPPLRGTFSPREKEICTTHKGLGQLPRILLKLEE